MSWIAGPLLGLSVAGAGTEPHLSGSRHKEPTMTDEKKKPEKDEVTDEQLEAVAGGADEKTDDETASNIMKSRHETAKNSINNIR